MLRNLRTRVNKLVGNREPAAVLDALTVLEETGTAPPGSAGERANELWQEALARGFAPGFEASLWCHLQATGKTVAQLMIEETSDPS